MKILCIYRHYWPDITPYARLLKAIAEHLVSEGHEVTVFTGQPGYNDVRQGSQPWREKLNGVDVIRVWLPPERKRFVVLRLLGFLWFLGRAVDVMRMVVLNLGQTALAFGEVLIVVEVADVGRDAIIAADLSRAAHLFAGQQCFIQLLAAAVSAAANGKARTLPADPKQVANSAAGQVKTVLITGAKGFVGRNLATHLKRRDDVRVLEYGRENSDSELQAWVAEADVVFHLAGVNRPEKTEEFETGNGEFTRRLCALLSAGKRKPQLIFSSSIQSELDNPYGVSKRHAEQALQELAAKGEASVTIFRLKNIFGKWCRPNYNSVVATFCHNIAHDLPIQVNDPDRRLDLVHVDDVVAAFLKEMDEPRRPTDEAITRDSIPSCAITLGELVERIKSFRGMQTSLQIPDFSQRLNRQLYATYLTYVDPARWEYGLDIKSDARGNLAEFIKSPGFGQVFISRTRPGITRGNHFHHVKTEKFMVVAGEGLIRFRHVDGGEILEYHVRGADYRVVDIPPGYTHSITNVGSKQMITLFWASEIFDPSQPDTHFLPVDPAEETSLKPMSHAIPAVPRR